MSSVTANCPNCGKALRAPVELAGRKGKCGACSSVFTIPSLPTAPAAAPAPTPPPSAWAPAPSKSFGAPAPQSNGCPNCGSALAPEAVVCIQCGYDRRTGHAHATQRMPAGGKPLYAPAPRPAPAPQYSGAFGAEKRGMDKGVLGGLAMMVIAVVWFFGALQFHILFYYPPILFVIGLVAFFKGLFTGNFTGNKARGPRDPY